jgi:hypothetical protein
MAGRANSKPDYYDIVQWYVWCAIKVGDHSALYIYIYVCVRTGSAVPSSSMTGATRSRGLIRLGGGTAGSAGSMSRLNSAPYY